MLILRNNGICADKSSRRIPQQEIRTVIHPAHSIRRRELFVSCGGQNNHHRTRVHPGQHLPVLGKPLHRDPKPARSTTFGVDVKKDLRPPTDRSTLIRQRKSRPRQGRQFSTGRYPVTAADIQQQQAWQRYPAPKCRSSYHPVLRKNGKP